MKKYLPYITLIALVLAVAATFTINSCGQIAPFFGESNTQLKSSSLAAAHALGVTTCGTYEEGFWRVTPTSITGKVASVFFPIDNTEDEGIVVFGYYRPDLVTDNQDLDDFDLNTVTELSGIISKKPSYKGGTSSIILMLYGYFDVTFTRGSDTEVLRFCYGTSDPYTRGDVLRKNSSGDFQWLDLDNNTFTSTRPSNPYKIDSIAEFTDPSHPDMRFFPLAAKVTGGVELPVSLIDNYDLTFICDFDFEKALLFENITTQASFEGMAIADIVKYADMSQNRTENWHEVSGETDDTKIITCTVTIESTPK